MVLLYHACSKYGFHFFDNGAISKCVLSVTSMWAKKTSQKIQISVAYSLRMTLPEKRNVLNVLSSYECVTYRQQTTKLTSFKNVGFV